ncbi:amidohydrolase family protein [Streptomyces sp. NPDC055078]
MEERAQPERRFRSVGAPPSEPPPPPEAARDHAELLDALRARDGRPVVLLRGGCVLSQDPEVGDFAPGDVLIRDGRIAEVSASVREPADALVIDATDFIVLPGFVDAHVHAWEGQLRGTAPVLDFPAYMNYTRGGYMPHYSAHDVYVGTLATALVALDAGITTMIDNAYNNPSPGHADAAVEAVWDSGIRAVHASGSPTDGRGDLNWPRDVLRLRDTYFSSEDQRITLRLYATAPDVDLWRFAREHELWISTEMGSHVAEVDDVLRRMRDDGLLTHRHAFNHCYNLSAGSWSLIADAGVAVNLCPRSDAAFGLGTGFAEVDAALSAGVRPGLSGDNELSYGLSMFTEMQILLSGHRGRTFERAGAGAPPDSLRHLAPEEALEFATMGGARNAGLDSRVGSLTPGKEADVILVRTTDLNTAPASNAVATITSFAHAGNVDTVFVGGELRKFRGQLVGHDTAGVRAAAEASRDRLMAAQGLISDPLAPQGASPLGT